MTSPTVVNFSFAAYTLAEWSTSNAPLTSGFLAIVKDENNAFKIGDGVSSFSDLPYQGSTLLQVSYATVDLTRVYPKSFVILETDTSRLRIPDGTTEYSGLPAFDMKQQTVHPSWFSSKTQITTAETNAIRSIIDDISTIMVNGKRNVAVSATVIETSFADQSLNTQDYSLLTSVTNGTTVDYAADHTQLCLLMIDNLNKRLTVLESALL